MSRNAPSLTGEKATSGHLTITLGGVFKAEVALMPMFDTPEQVRPTRNNVCDEHRVQLKQVWFCPECKGTPAATTKVVMVDGLGPVEAPDGDWTALAKETDPTLDLGAWVQRIDPVSFSGASYFLFPNEKKEVGAYLIIMELLRKDGGYLLATTTSDHGTARVTAVSYHEPSGFLIAQHVHHTQYLRVEKAARIASAIDRERSLTPPDPTHIKLARSIFRKLPKTFRLEEVKDTLGEAQWAYVREKAKKMGHIIISDPPDLYEALVASQAKLALRPGRKPRARKEASKV